MSEETLVTVRLPARRLAALERVIDLQIACEESGMFAPPDLTPEERDEAMHGSRRPVQDGGGVIYPIACRAAELAERRDEELPACRWVADDSGLPGSVSCTRCGKSIGPRMARNETIRSMVDGHYLPSVQVGGEPDTIMRIGFGAATRAQEPGD